MRAEYDDSLSWFGRSETNRPIDRLLERVMQSFCVLHRIHYTAPWRADMRCRR